MLKNAGYNPTSLTESQVQVDIDSNSETRYSKGSGTELIITPPGVSTLVNLTHERDGTNQGLGGMDVNLAFFKRTRCFLFTCRYCCKQYGLL